jgi:Reverse transcriptase (RNA-dependent DNA polymerase)
MSREYSAFLNLLQRIEESNSYEIAKLDKKWCKVMEEEFHILEKNKRGKYICYQKKPIGCKWVYKIKYHSNYTVERYKANLVVKRYTQTYGINYYEIFVSIVKMNTVRILLSVAVNNGLKQSPPNER